MIARPRPSARRALIAAVGVVVVGVLALVATRPPAAVQAARTPLLGRPAPPIVATTATGQRFALAAVRGRVVVLDFLASWCSACVEEQGRLAAFGRAEAPRGVSMVGVAFEDRAVSVWRLVEASGADWPVLADPNGRIALDYGVTAPPEAFVIAPDGEVVAHFDGPVSLPTLEAVVARAATLREPPR